MTCSIYQTECSKYIEETNIEEVYTQQGTKPKRKPEGMFVLLSQIFQIVR